MAERLQGSYLAYSHSSGLLLQASVFMAVSRRPEEKSAATGNHSSSIGEGCCQQNRWPVKGAGLTAVPTQKLCCAISWSQLYLGKGKKAVVCGKGACIYFECSKEHVPQWVGMLRYDNSS